MQKGTKQPSNRVNKNILVGNYISQIWGDLENKLTVTKGNICSDCTRIDCAMNSCVFES